MSLFDDLKRSDETDCKLCFYLSTITPEKRLEWNNVLRFPSSVIPNMNVVRYLGRHGVLLTEASVRRHRKNHASR